jgi:hypothetical protein
MPSLEGFQISKGLLVSTSTKGYGIRNTQNEQEKAAHAKQDDLFRGEPKIRQPETKEQPPERTQRSPSESPDASHGRADLRR